MNAHIFDSDCRDAAALHALQQPCCIWRQENSEPEQIVELAAEHGNLQGGEGVQHRRTPRDRVAAHRWSTASRCSWALTWWSRRGRVRVGVASLVNAFPEIGSVVRVCARWVAPTKQLYEWFLPLLRLDTLPKLVQLIKLAQELVGRGSGPSRPPRLPLTDAERGDGCDSDHRHSLHDRRWLAALAEVTTYTMRFRRASSKLRLGAAPAGPRAARALHRRRHRLRRRMTPDAALEAIGSTRVVAVVRAQSARRGGRGRAGGVSRRNPCCRSR